MSAFFDGTNHSIPTIDPVLVYPFSLGFWAQPAVTGTLGAWQYFTGSTDGWNVSVNASNQWTISSTQASALQTTAIATPAVAAGVWYYVVARFISATNRRISVYQNDGTTGSAQNTTSSTPSGANTLTIARAPSNRWNGLIAEHWLADGDIQPDGLALNQNTLMKLAFGGPLSVPSIVSPRKIIYYASMRSPMKPTSGVVYSDILSNRSGFSFNPVLSSIGGIHPPLPASYPIVKPILRPSWILSYPDAPAATGTARTQIYMYG